jgi:ubiquinone/menaquinone biosynthesis C-methylase UbiE
MSVSFYKLPLLVVHSRKPLNNWFGEKSMKERGALTKPMSSFAFKLMSLMFKVRDLLRPRSDVLKEAGIEPGSVVLDFGCGSGGYIAPLVELVGPSGKIHALDIHPLAIREVKKIAKRKRLENIETIESDCRTGLPDNSVDTVLLYDVFHNLVRPDEVLREIHRVLKAEGTLSFSDHHMKEEEVFTQVTGAGIFRFVRKGRKTYSFAKAD